MNATGSTCPMKCLCGPSWLLSQPSTRPLSTRQTRFVTAPSAVCQTSSRNLAPRRGRFRMIVSSTIFAGMAFSGNRVPASFATFQFYSRRVIQPSSTTSNAASSNSNRPHRIKQAGNASRPGPSSTNELETPYRVRLFLMHVEHCVKLCNL